MKPDPKASDREFDEKAFRVIQERCLEAEARFTCSIHKKHPKIKLANLGSRKMTLGIEACCEEFERAVWAEFIQP